MANTTTSSTNGINITSIKSGKNTVELIRDIKSMGVNSEFLSVDGIKFGIVSYTSEADRERAIKVIQTIVDNSSNHGMALAMEIVTTITTQAAMNEAEVEPETAEEIEVEGIPMIIDYNKRVIYYGLNNELVHVADLSDLSCDMPNEATKALLVERAKSWCTERAEEWECECDECDECEDDWDDECYDDDWDKDEEYPCDGCCSNCCGCD